MTSHPIHSHYEPSLPSAINIHIHAYKKAYISLQFPKLLAGLLEMPVWIKSLERDPLIALEALKALYILLHLLLFEQSCQNEMFCSSFSLLAQTEIILPAFKAQVLISNTQALTRVTTPQPIVPILLCACCEQTPVQPQ